MHSADRRVINFQIAAAMKQCQYFFVTGKRTGFGSKFSISVTWELVGTIIKYASRRFHRYRGRLCVLHIQNHFYAPQVPASADIGLDIGIIQTFRFATSARNVAVGFAACTRHRRVV